MCKNAAGTATTLMKALEPEVKNLLDFEISEGHVTAAQETEVLTAYEAALTSLENWQQGSTATDVLQLLGVFNSVFNSLPFPAQDKFLANTILATIATIVGLVEAHSPAPAPATPMAEDHTVSEEDSLAMHISTTQHETQNKVAELAPDFKPSRFHSPEHQQKSYWNKKVQEGVVLWGDAYAKLKVI